MYMYTCMYVHVYMYVCTAVYFLSVHKHMNDNYQFGCYVKPSIIHMLFSGLFS